MTLLSPAISVAFISTALFSSSERTGPFGVTHPVSSDDLDVVRVGRKGFVLNQGLPDFPGCGAVAGGVLLLIGCRFGSVPVALVDLCVIGRRRAVLRKRNN